MKLTFDVVQKRFSFRAMSIHVVMIGGARPFHFMDRFLNMLVYFFQIAPIADRFSESGARGERESKHQEERKLFHGTP